MELNVASCLAEGQLTIEQILIDEARHLCESSPIPNVVNHPTASKSALTEKAKMGVGPAHCVFIYILLLHDTHAVADVIRVQRNHQLNVPIYIVVGVPSMLLPRRMTW